jgi:hypothetical protein
MNRRLWWPPAIDEVGVEAEALQLGDAPRRPDLAPHPVTELRRLLEHEN